jgi:hypothetical protein
MNNLKELRKQFDQGVDNLNKKNNNAFKLSKVASVNGLKKVVKSFLIISAISASFSVTAHDVQQFEQDIKVEHLQNSTVPVIDLNHIAEHYKIDLPKSDYDINKSVLKEYDSRSIKTGLYENPFNGSQVTIIKNSDFKMGYALDIIKENYQKSNIDTKTIENFYEALENKYTYGYNLSNASLPEKMAQRIIESTSDHFAPETEPRINIVTINEDYDFFQHTNKLNVNSDENNIINRYSKYLATTHEMHHSAVDNFRDDHKIGEENKFISASMESSADYGAVFKTIQKMKKDGHGDEEVNHLLESILYARNTEITNVNASHGYFHYTTPTVAIVKEIWNKNPDHILNISNADLLKESVSVAATIVEDGYEADFTEKYDKLTQKEKNKVLEKILPEIIKEKRDKVKVLARESKGKPERADILKYLIKYGDTEKEWIDTVSEISIKDPKFQGEFVDDLSTSIKSKIMATVDIKNGTEFPHIINKISKTHEYLDIKSKDINQDVISQELDDYVKNKQVVANNVKLNKSVFKRKI